MGVSEECLDFGVVVSVEDEQTGRDEKLACKKDKKEKRVWRRPSREREREGMCYFCCVCVCVWCVVAEERGC